MYALTTAHAYIKSGMAQKALVIGAETFSRILDWNDRATLRAVGDGAGAVVLGASDEPGIIGGKLQADGAHLGLLPKCRRIWPAAKFVATLMWKWTARVCLSLP